MIKRFLAVTTLILGLIGANNAFAGEVKFVQVSDAHVSANNTYSQDVLEAAVKDINALENVSFVAFTGDNIDSSKIENLEAFLKIINKLKAPYYIVLGNHDVFKSNGLSKVRYFEVVKSHNWFYWHTKPNYVLKKLFPVQMDTTKRRLLNGLIFSWKNIKTDRLLCFNTSL